MTIHLEKASGAKTLFPRGIKTAAGVKGITKITVKTPTGDKIVFDKAAVIGGSLVVTDSTDVAYGAIATKGGAAAPVVTNAVTAYAAGGTVPYTYEWALTTDDGNGGTWTATSPNTAGTAFRASSVSEVNSPSTATFTCTATDARGATGTVTITALASNNSV